MPRRPSGKENDASAPAPKKPALSTRAGESGGGLEAKLARKRAERRREAREAEPPPQQRKIEDVIGDAAS